MEGWVVFGLLVVAWVFGAMSGFLLGRVRGIIAAARDMQAWTERP